MDGDNELMGPDEERCWEALSNPQYPAGVEFYYGVRTTGVYCRPGCKSRRPRRENVRFFTTTQAAERAGFRPCKRCNPSGAQEDSAHRTLIMKAVELIESVDEPLSLEYLAGKLGLSSFHFQRLFKKTVGISPKEYYQEKRAGRVRSLLKGEERVSDVIYQAGFGSSRGFYSQAAGSLGMTPGDYRKGGAGMQIFYAVQETSLGWTLVAATERGVCAVIFGENTPALEQDLRARFPGADCLPADETYKNWVAAVIAYLDTPQKGINLPLDVCGTAFQRRVWAALREIPCGTTATYAEIAGRIGQPKAARAVAQACASNPIAGVIPCHRVVRADGDLGGYRWGLPRKRSLLEREKAPPVGDGEGI
jgi:AraC family transcriptional regulator of adaptative response/methylated-DNA-[protein]-cysteine methyltransferase